ncbi:MAG: cytochrome c, partial [Bacteroidota bacterium]
MKYFTLLFGVAGILILLVSLNVIQLDNPAQAAEKVLIAEVDTIDQTYQTLCASCHGKKLNGFLDREWKRGKNKDSIMKTINVGLVDLGMPAFGAALTDAQMSGLADYVLKAAERESQYAFEEEEIKTDTFTTASFKYELDTIADGMESPWGLAFLPD